MAYGAALAFAPSQTARRWIGADGTRPGAGVALRALGAREIVLHAGAAAAAVTGAPVRPWLMASIGGDCSDVAATFGAGSHLPDGAALKTLAVAGGSAALSAAVVAVLDR
jgi:hypothetical protein